MIIPIIQIIGGLLLLFGGGEVLVRGAVGLARSFGLPTIVIGLTIVAYGTSAPELVVSIQAAMKGYSSIAIGNVIGSNISNILLVLGFSSIIYPIACGENKRDSFVMIGATLLLTAFCFNGTLGRVEGIVFLLLLATYTIIIFKSNTKLPSKNDINAKVWCCFSFYALLQNHCSSSLEQEPATVPKRKNSYHICHHLIATWYKHKQEEEIPETKLKIWQAGLLVLGGVTLLVIGSDLLVDGGIVIARSFGVSEAVIGLTLVAVGSSAPELVTSVVAALRKHSDVAIGNIIGSNIVNVFGILGITGSITPIEVEQKFINFDFWVMIAVTVLMVIAMNTGKKIGRIEGGVFFVGYIAYIGSQFL